MKDPIVRLESVELAFGKDRVLEGVDLEVAPGERLVVMGQSGGGKSTLLRLMMGILIPTAGRVLVKEQNVPSLNRMALNELRRNMAMVYQYSALISSMTVRENLALPLEEWTRKGRDEIDSIIEDKLSRVGMAHVKEKLPAELSGGMRKRVGLARALVLEPELILFDEPSAGLDPISSTVIDELIVSLSEELGTTCIIVTHEMDSAFRIATRMAMLYKGKIIVTDSPEHFRHPEHPVVRQFVEGRTEGPMTETQDS